MKSTLPVGQIGLFKQRPAEERPRIARALLPARWSYASSYTFEGERRACTVVVVNRNVVGNPRQRRAVDVLGANGRVLEGTEGYLVECETWLTENGVSIPDGGLMASTDAATVPE